MLHKHGVFYCFEYFVFLFPIIRLCLVLKLPTFLSEIKIKDDKFADKVLYKIPLQY